MDQIGYAHAGPQRPASSPSVNGSASFARPFDEIIDLSGAVSFADTFPIFCSESSAETTELRVGEAEDYLFIRVKCVGMMIEVSSGLSHEGVRCEAWHGVSSGESVRGRLQLRCALKFDGETFKLDMRVRGDDADSDTLIYGCSRYEGAVLGARARVGLYDIDGEGHPALPSVKFAGCAAPKKVKGSPVANANGNGNGNGCCGKCDGSSVQPAKPSESRVRFCESDQWYQYEVPKLSGAAGQT